MARGYLFLFRGKGFRSSRSALLAPEASQLDGGRMFSVLDVVLDLPGGDIDDQLPELDRVARTLETTGCHVG